MPSPTGFDPVKATKRVLGWATIAFPKVAPDPGQKFTTPAGSPASSSTSINNAAIVGESLEGFPFDSRQIVLDLQKRREVKRRCAREFKRLALHLGDPENIRFKTSLASSAKLSAQPLDKAEQTTSEHPEDAHLLFDQVDRVTGDQGRVATDVLDRAVVPR